MMNHMTAVLYLMQADRSAEQMNRADLRVRPVDITFVQYHLNAFTSEGCCEGCSVCVCVWVLASLVFLMHLLLHLFQHLLHSLQLVILHLDEFLCLTVWCWQRQDG